jgi:translation initiation factor 1 (eIF-1/SUI1)
MDIRLFFGMKYGTSSNIQIEHVQVQGNLREHIISVIDGKDSCVGKNMESRV